MKLNKYIKNITLISVITCSIGLCTFLYNSFAKDVGLVDEKLEDAEKEESNKESSESEDIVLEGDELGDDSGVVGESSDSLEEDVVNGTDNEVKEDDAEVDIEIDDNEKKEESIISQEEVDKVEDKVEMQVKALIEADVNLPKLVGINASKNNSTTGMPLLPGFKNENGVYVCNLNNMYQSEVRMYETEENGVKKVILKVGYEVVEDGQLQGIVKTVLNYYSGCKWEFVYKGIDSHFEILI